MSLRVNSSCGSPLEWISRGIRHIFLLISFTCPVIGWPSVSALRPNDGHVREMQENTIHTYVFSLRAELYRWLKTGMDGFRKRSVKWGDDKESSTVPPFLSLYILLVGQYIVRDTYCLSPNYRMTPGTYVVRGAWEVIHSWRRDNISFDVRETRQPHAHEVKRMVRLSVSPHQKIIPDYQILS